MHPGPAWRKTFTPTPVPLSSPRSLSYLRLSPARASEKMARSRPVPPHLTAGVRVEKDVGYAFCYDSFVTSNLIG